MASYPSLCPNHEVIPVNATRPYFCDPLNDDWRKGWGSVEIGTMLEHKVKVNEMSVDFTKGVEAANAIDATLYDHEQRIAELEKENRHMKTRIAHFALSILALAILLAPFGLLTQARSADFK